MGQVNIKRAMAFIDGENLLHRYEAMLAAGMHTDALPGLAGEAEAHPLRDRLVALRMLGLFRAGRQPEATRAFQAIRIKVNRELDDLRELLDAALDMLRTGGRLVVISFHSLEDRMVKRYMRDMARGEMLPRDLPVPDSAVNRRMKLIGKPVKAGSDEVDGNVRSRSAIMRVAEKIA